MAESRKRKEVKTMKYEKPTIVELVSAIEAIQHTPMGKGIPDVVEGAFVSTPNAYEADE
jgi:hypothetical protein